jgi:hypothetical protein
VNRRDAISKVAIMMGGAISAPTMMAMLDSCKSPSKAAANGTWALAKDQQTLLAELAEVILPKTTTPGAKEAGVGPFIEKMLADCYSPAQQEHFAKGLTDIESAADKAVNKSFMACTPTQQVGFLKAAEAAAKEESKNIESAAKIKDPETGLEKTAGKDVPALVPFFKLLKELTLFGYFTSEQGAKNALAYVEVPGKYESVTLKPGQKSWALN